MDEPPGEELYKFPTMGQLSKMLDGGSQKTLDVSQQMDKVSEKSITDFEVPEVIHTNIEIDVLKDYSPEKELDQTVIKEESVISLQQIEPEIQKLILESEEELIANIT